MLQQIIELGWNKIRFTEKANSSKSPHSKNKKQMKKETREKGEVWQSNASINELSALRIYLFSSKLSKTKNLSWSVSACCAFWLCVVSTVSYDWLHGYNRFLSLIWSDSSNRRTCETNRSCSRRLNLSIFVSAWFVIAAWKQRDVCSQNRKVWIGTKNAEATKSKNAQ